jgi:hypothetical protein
MRAGRIKGRVNSYSTRDTIADETDDASALSSSHTPSFPPFSDKGLVIPVGTIRLGGYHCYWRLTAPGWRQVIDKSMRVINSMNAPHSNIHLLCSPITITVSLRSQGDESIVLNRNVQDEWIVGHNRDGAPPPRGTATALTFSLIASSLHQGKPSPPLHHHVHA